MLRKIALVLPLFLLCACGDFKNPFADDKPYVPTAVPADFAIVVDENHDNFVNRQHIQQVITSADSMSRTTYISYRDFNDAISDRFSQETPLTPSQVQSMWNSVAEKNLMEGSSLWINWLSDTDLHQRNSFIIQIRANGKTRTYRQTNGFSGPVRPLMLLVSAVRLPISRDANTTVIGAPAAEPALATAPASAPATAPAAEPAPASATAPATQP
jgi:hypothetical protein